MVASGNSKDSICYSELLIPVRKYFWTLKRSEAIFEIGLPLIITLFVYLAMSWRCISIDSYEFISSIVPLLSILIGFNSTCIVVLLTSNSTNVGKLQQEQTYGRNLVDGKKLSLYQLLLLNTTYVLITQVFLLISGIIINFSNKALANWLIISLTYLLFLFLLHSLFVTVRNTSNIFFSFWKIQ